MAAAEADLSSGDDAAATAPDYRDDARRLATEAAERYQAAEFDVALDLFVRAAKLYDAPTLRFWQARCLDKLGRLVEAEERYSDVVREKLKDDVPDAFKQAQRDSRTALIELRKRLPTITIRIENAKDISLVELDGRPLPEPLIGAPVAVNPGTHEVKVTRSSGAVRTESVAIVESQAQQVYVKFDKPKSAPLAPLLPGEESSQPPAPSSNVRTILGWSALGLGAAGFAFGGYAGLRASNTYNSLEQNCLDDQCAEPFHSDLDSFRSWRRLSSIGYALGFVGVGTGCVLLLLGDERSGATALYLSPTSAALNHQF